MNLPVCPKHPRSRVCKDGFYGRPKRQRYRCVPAGHPEEWHRFVEPLPRVRTPAGQCDYCERPLDWHEGPPVPREHEFPVRHIADALAAVGRGVSYREAGYDARDEHGRRRANERSRSREATLVQGWVEVFTPVLHAALDDHDAWPRVLMLDSMPVVGNTDLPGGMNAFYILGAVGYAGPKPETWGLWATHRATQRTWEEFLSSRPGQPEWLVCDWDAAMMNAAQKVFHTPLPLLWLCEWHLQRSLKKLLSEAGVPELDYLWTSSETAMQDTATWDTYRAELRRVRPAGRRKSPEKWLEKLLRWTGGTREEQIGWQIANRDSAAGKPRSNGPIEAEFTHLREDVFKGRAHAYRNQPRTNLMLQLVQLQRNQKAQRRAYTRLISDHLRQNGGISNTRRRLMHEHAGHHSLRP